MIKVALVNFGSINTLTNQLQSIKIQMKFVFLLFLIAVGLTVPTVIVQSNLSTKIVTNGQTVSYAGILNTNNAAYLGVGTVWIWNQKGDLSPKGTKLTFQSLFYMSCGAAPVLKISAQASFVAYLDGVQVGTGSNWKTIYSFNLKAGCGSHNLTIVVTRGSNPGAGLIFTVSQDQSNCFNCGSNGFWNTNTCQCQCLPSSCSCKAPRSYWAAYPTCACTCPPTPIIITPTSVAAVQTEAYKLYFCLAGYYRDPLTCACKCVQQWCPPKHYWDSDKCACYPIIY